MKIFCSTDTLLRKVMTSEIANTNMIPLSRWVNPSDDPMAWDAFESGCDIPLVTQSHQPTEKRASFVVTDDDVWQQLCEVDDLNPHKKEIYTIDYLFDPTFDARQQVIECRQRLGEDVSPCKFNEDDIRMEGYILQLLEDGDTLPSSIDGRVQIFVGHKNTLERIITEYDSQCRGVFLFDFNSIPPEYQTTLHISTMALNYAMQ